MKKLTSAIVASSLVLGLVGTAAADFSPAGVNEAAARMKALGVVKGVAQPDGSTDLMLNKPITRAELVTIIVRAFGKEDLAKLLKGSPAFSDSAQHWASGEIAMAKNIIESKGHTLGVTPTTFVPNKEVSSAEAIAFVMKFLGVKENTTLSWPMNFIQGAVDAGLITEADKATLSVAPNSAAIRGLVFYLADHAFSSYKLADTGKSVYTSYVDTTAPVVSVDSFEATTEAETVTLTGKVSGHKALHVSTTAGNTAAAVEADLDGTWSATLNLKVGDNEIWVHAVDIAGNVATASGVTITRVAGAAATVEATDITVAAGQSVDVGAIVKDAKGNVVAKPALTGDAGELGTFADGKFTAGTKAGEGTLTLTVGEISTVVNVTVTAGALADLTLTTDPAATTVAVGTPLKLVTTGVDAYGNAVEVTGVTYTASNGIVDANGNFAATVAGAAKVTASAGGMTKELTINVYSAASKLGVTTSKDVVRNGESKSIVTVQVQDANGFTVASYNENVTVTVVGQTGDLTIMDGSTDKGDTYTVKAVNGVATFTLKSQVAGTANATGRIQATSGTLTGALKDIALVKPVLTSFKASVDVANIEAATTAGARVTVKAYDQEDVNVGASSQYTVTFSSSNTEAITIDGAVNNALTETFTVGLASNTFDVKATAVPGTANLTAVVKDNSSNVVSIPINTLTINTAIGYAASQLRAIDADDIQVAATATTAKTFKVAKLDSAGSVLTRASEAFTPAIKVVAADGTDATAKFTIVAGASVNGISTVTILPSGNETAGAYTIEATSGSLTKGTGKITVNPGSANKVTFTADNTTVAGDGISNVVLTAKVLDAKGNVVSFNGNITLKVAEGLDGSNLTMPSSATVAAVNGTATWTLVAKNILGTDTFTLEGDLDGDGTATGLSDGAAPASVAVTTQLTGVASKLVIGAATYGYNELDSDATVGSDAAGIAGTKKAGESYTVKVYVKDAQTPGNTVTSDNGRPITLVIKSGTGTIETATVNTVNGVATFKVSSTKGATASDDLTSNLVFYAENSGVTKSGDSTAYFQSGDKAKIVMAANTTSLQVGTATNVTAKYVDAYGNFIAGAPSLKNITVSGSAGTLSGTDTATTDTDGAFVLTAANIPASGALTAEENVASNALPVDTVSLNVYNAGLAYRAQIDTIADLASTKNTITAKVKLVDYNGLQLTTLENAVANVPFMLKVTNPDGSTYTFDGADGTHDADSYVDGVATFTYTMPLTSNAGQYKFEVLAYPASDAAARDLDNELAYTTDEANLFAALKTTSTTMNVTPSAATAAKLVALLPAGGEAATNFDFDAATNAGTGYNEVSVAFVKLVAVDAKGNVDTSFNGTGKVKLTGGTNVTLVGANTSGEVTVTITNGYGVAQIQRALGTATTGTLTGTLTINNASSDSALGFN